MPRKISLALFSILATSSLATSSAYAQSDQRSATGTAAGTAADIGQTQFGLLTSARQQPNVTPSAPSSRPANNSAASSWPPATTPYQSYAFAGGKLSFGGTVATFYDDNVFASRSNRLSDVAFVARPELAWAAQGKNYSVGVDGYVEGRKYVRFDSEDQVNGSVGGNFTVMPNSDTQVIGNARYIRGHLDRGTSETIDPISGVLLSTTFDRPIAYDQALGSIALNKRYDRWYTSLGFAGLGINYQNAPIPGGIVDFGYADGGIAVVNGRLGYVISPLTSVFVEAAGNTRDWRVNAFDSNGYRVVGGVLFENGANARVKGEVWAGYMSQQYNGVSFQNVSTWTFGAALAFLFTDKLTGVIEGKREAKEAALKLALLAPGVIGASDATCAIIPGGASCVSAIESTIGGRLEYRLLPNVSVGGGATFMVDDYLGPVAGNRSDRTVSPLASVKYFPNDRVVFGFDYRRVNFNPVGGQYAGVAAISYYRDVYLLSMNGKF